MFQPSVFSCTLLLVVCHSLKTVASFDTPTSSVTSGKQLSTRIVTTKYGAYRGFIHNLPSRSLQPVEVFLGVRYASPPVGKLRFMPPVTSSHWTGVKNALSPGPICPQKIALSDDAGNTTTESRHHANLRSDSLRSKLRSQAKLQNQSEDCLYLNIYAPAFVSKKSSRLPVIMFVHGEFHDWNAGSNYDGSVLASFGNVIVVTINYRLGVLGFFPALDGSSPGNFGLMDCVASLHWIQENIGEFGGDSSNVTIFGQGQGAAFVNILMMAPMAKGLFHLAILSSGSVLSPWALASNALEYTKKLASALGCPNESHRSSLMLYCLRQKTASEILEVDLDIPSHLVAFGPTVDGMVIPNEPLLLMGDVPSYFGNYDLMFGVTAAEGYNGVSHYEKHGIDTTRRDRILRTLVRNLFTYHLQEIFLTLVNEYTDWNRSPSNPSNIWESLIELLGDALVVAPTVKTGTMHSKFPTRKSSTYFYQFQYASESTGTTRTRLGAAHGDDLAFVFGAPLVPGYQLGMFPTNYSKAEASLSEMVITYWTNFAKFGNPNGDPKLVSNSEASVSRGEKVHWPLYDEDEQQYLSITTKPKIKDHYHSHRLSYWLNLLPKLHVAGSSSSLEHHLLDDHDNMLTYEGKPRVNQYHLKLAATSPTVANNRQQQPAITDDTSKSSAAGGVGGAGIASNDSSTTTNSLSSPLPSPLLPTTPLSPTSNDKSDSKSAFDGIKSSKNGNSINASISMMMQQSSYSTALSVTIAIGCSLLILNVLVFAGIFYRRDKANYQQNSNNKSRQDETNVSQKTNNSDLPSPVKLNAFVGCSLYPGDPSMTLGRMSPSPLRTPTPPPPSHQHIKNLTGHVAMVNPAYYSQNVHDNNTGKGNKVLTVRGTVEFDRDRTDMKI